MADRIKKYVTDTATSSCVVDFDNSLNNLKLDHPDEEDYTKELNSIINGWKSEYIDFVKI